MSSKRSKSPLQNPNLGFFISLILVEISYFLFQSTQTKIADNFMLGFTYIGEIYFVGTFVLIWSIYAIRTKKYHLIQYLYLNLFMTVILTYMVLSLIHI